MVVTKTIYEIRKTLFENKTGILLFGSTCKTNIYFFENSIITIRLRILTYIHHFNAVIKMCHGIRSVNNTKVVAVLMTLFKK